jgi:hypothetical protein
MILAVPAATPVAAPVSGTMEEMPGLLLLHEPVEGLLVNVAPAPVQYAEGPEIADGRGFTVTTTAAKQLPGMV